MTLLDHLIKKFPNAKRQTLKRMVQDRRVTINGIPATLLKQAVAESDRIEMRSSKQPVSQPASRVSLPFPTVFEDADILVINKPAGLLTSTVPRERRPTALAAVRNYLAVNEPDARPGLIHRLDRDASGLLIFSKNEESFQSLKQQFVAHSVERIYMAVVSPAPTEARGTIESQLVEYADGSVHTTRHRAKGQRAVTEFVVTKRFEEFALLRVKLQTGRKHQIRAHLSEMRFPIVGDTVYGGLPLESGLMLAAVELEIDHPKEGGRKKFKIPPPNRIAELVAKWR